MFCGSDSRVTFNDRSDFSTIVLTHQLSFSPLHAHPAQLEVHRLAANRGARRAHLRIEGAELQAPPGFVSLRGRKGSAPCPAGRLSKSCGLYTYDTGFTENYPSGPHMVSNSTTHLASVRGPRPRQGPADARGCTGGSTTRRFSRCPSPAASCLGG